MLADTPFLDWMPLREMELEPLVPGVEMLCVMLGALVPCLLVFCIIRPPLQRVVTMGVVLAATLLVLIPEFGRGLAEYRMLLFGLAMVLIMVWRPGGLLAHREPTLRFKPLQQSAPAKEAAR